MRVKDELYWQIRAFLRTFENDCKACLRDKSNCLTCRNARAVRLAKTMDAGQPEVAVISEGQFKHVRFMAEIFAKLVAAQRPLMAKEIKVKCSRSFKEWILKKMILLGRIEREPCGNNLYRYKTKGEKQ